MVAPGTRECPTCHTDLQSGKRAPLLRRLQRVSIQRWTLLLLLLGVGGIGAALSVSYFRTRPAPAPAASAEPPTVVDTATAKRQAQRVLAAENPRALQLALDELARLGPAGGQALLQALDASLSGPASPPLRASQSAAIGYLARAAQPGAGAVFARAQKIDELRFSALCARALQLDAAVQDDLAAAWVGVLREQLFFAHPAILAGPESVDALRSRQARLAHDAAQLLAALRALVAREDSDTIERLAEHYWGCWSWLGQKRDEAFTAALFDVAKPPEQELLDAQEATQEIRSARRALERAAQRGAPRVQAVIGLTLAQRAPQYQRAKQRIVSALAQRVGDVSAPDQQRVTWALAAITARTFGAINADASPLDARRDDVNQVVQWARSTALATPAAPKAPASAYASPPKLTRRIVTAERQLEHELLGKLAGDWQQLDFVLDRWRVLELPFTPRLQRLLDPSQRSPDLPSLTAAIVLAAERNEQAVSAALGLWREAREQPGWVRAMADTALASLAARNGTPDPAWPGRLSSIDLVGFEDGTPGWSHLTRLIAAGGARMAQQLRTYRGPALTPAVQARLLAGVEQALRTPG